MNIKPETTEVQDWKPTEDLRFRLVFYKADFRALLGYAERTVEVKMSEGAFPAPDFYDGKRAAWLRETIFAYLKARKASHDGTRRVFPGKDK